MFSLSLKQYIHTFILVEYIKIKVTGNEKTHKMKWLEYSYFWFWNVKFHSLNLICNKLEFACQYELNKQCNKIENQTVAPNWQPKQRRTQTKKSQKKTWKKNKIYLKTTFLDKSGRRNAERWFEAKIDPRSHFFNGWGKREIS